MSKKILIVDDQGELRKLVRLTLQFNDYELHEAEDATKALRYIKILRPDVVVLDVMMPGEIDGYQLCDIIKNDPALKSIHVVLLTARGTRKDLQEGERVKADSYLVKPFSPLELADVVKKASA